MRVIRYIQPRGSHERIHHAKEMTILAVFSILVTTSAFSTTTRGRIFVTHGCNSNCRDVTATSHVHLSSSRVGSLSARSNHLFLTRLQYRDGYDDDSFRISPHSRGWVPSFAAAGGTEGGDDFSSKDTSTEQQEVVDDYLKFLDKRYNRLRSGENKREATFSVWKWITNGVDTVEGSEWNVPRVDTHQNSLYVLGVADLASQKLLQKHQLSSKRLQEERKGVDENEKVVSMPELVIDAEVISTTRTFASVSSMKGLSHFLARVTSLRKVLIQFQALKIRELLVKLAFGIRFGTPKLAKFLFFLGGGKRTIALTMSAVASVTLLVIRPMIEATMSEGAVMGGRIG